MKSSFSMLKSECFGDTSKNKPADEEAPFCPRSPYAVAKSTAYWLVSNYRNFIIYFAVPELSNHESLGSK